MFSVSELFSSWRTVARSSALAAAFVAAVSLVGANSANAQAITEDFADVTALPAAGWVQTNHSNPVGTTVWFQGNSSVFPSQAGAATAYVGANFNSTGGAGTISNWLFVPTRTLNNGDVFTFWTRSVSTTFPDRMQVRLSTNGSSTNIGTTENDVGDFTNLLLDINPTLTDQYPIVWTQYTITISGLAGPTSGRLAFRYFVVDGGPSGNNSNYIGIDTFTYTPSGGPVAPTQHVLDYNGDGKTDYAVVRNTGGGANGQVTWFECNASGASQQCSGNIQAAFGTASDFFVSGDFDGDSKSDIAVWRPGAPSTAAFYIFQSSNSTLRTDVFGQSGDDPSVVGDYTGDGKADPAVYRGGAASGDQSFWFYRASSGANSGNIVYTPWGANGDFPAPGDYDGNGMADFMIQRNGGGGQANFWLYANGPGTISTYYFGTPTDVIVPGDYDGDGKTDIATIRGIGGAINWFVRKSSSPADSPYFGVWGLSASDFPTQGDFDGDGKTDLAVWRPNADPTQNYFFVRTSSAGTLAQTEWGQNGDYPVNNYNAH